MNKLTFKEVLSQGVAGQVWESKYKIISIFENEIKMTNKNGEHDIWFINNNNTFELQREQVDFTTAFSEYESGKTIIESVVTGKKYHRSYDLRDDLVYSSGINTYVINKSENPTFNEIRGKWYVFDYVR